MDSSGPWLERLEKRITEKVLAYTVERIRGKVEESEFTAVTDVHLLAENERHRFVRDTLRDTGVEAVPREGLAVWTAKMRPLIQ